MKYIFCSNDIKELNQSFKSNNSVVVYSGSINDFIQKNIPNVAYVCPFNHLGKLMDAPCFPDTQSKLTSNLNARKTINLDIGYSTIVPSSYADIFVISPVLTSASALPHTKNLFWATVAVNNHVHKYNKYKLQVIKTIIFPDFSKILLNLNEKTIVDQLSGGLDSDLNFDIFPSDPDVYFTRYGTYRR